LAYARWRARELVKQAPASVVKEPVSMVKEESGAYEVWVSPKPQSKGQPEPSVTASK
jgi:hypothetical protein